MDSHRKTCFLTFAAASAKRWRYLDVNYRPSSSSIYDVAQSGLLLGVTFNLK
jgi:hypothetical protein